ncbi:MAG: hypothetical protein D6732_21155 [Methanobacteriota archaeon]|nr:MAG: hypothetical protein D6732_21155 [Euryarchaeota archaeon]
MNKQKVVFEQVDRLFFRANAPFDRFAKTWEVIGGQFPPSAFTLVGAFRAAIARENGWNGQGKWNNDIAALVGKDIHDIEPLDFFGPFIEKDGKTFVPAPNFIVKQEEGFNFLRPDESVNMVIPSAEKPVHPLRTNNSSSFDNIKDGYITLEQLKGFLNLETAQPIEQLWKGSDFHEGEFQPGVFLEIGSKSSANERGFFTREYVRFREKVNLSMYLQSSDKLQFQRLVTPLGGEGKFGVIKLEENKQLELPKIKQLNKDDQGCKFFIYFLTHYRPNMNDDHERINVLDALVEDLQLNDVRFIGSTVGKPLRIGGWNMFCNKPIQLDAFVPAGSVFFFRAEETQEMEILAGSRTKIGQFTRFGFGQFLVGTW